MLVHAFHYFLMNFAFRKNHDWNTPVDHLLQTLLAWFISEFCLKEHSKFPSFCLIRYTKMTPNWYAIWSTGAGVKGPGDGIRIQQITLLFCVMRCDARTSADANSGIFLCTCEKMTMMTKPGLNGNNSNNNEVEIMHACDMFNCSNTFGSTKRSC